MSLGCYTTLEIIYIIHTLTRIEYFLPLPKINCAIEFLDGTRVDLITKRNSHLSSQGSYRYALSFWLQLALIWLYFLAQLS
jgi:hypothetical protein